MKKLGFILNCLLQKIKKKFFKSEKTDISHDCRKALRELDEISAVDDIKLTNEYIMKYHSTTRWQTL
jgi:hypothetical protein